jgi:15-cis-phytoene synthase
MNPLELYDKTAIECSKKVANNYSTSFSLGIKLISPELRWAIYGIYGMVRYADEIVDTFYHTQQKELLLKFKEETYLAIELGISLNPVLHSFQKAANQYGIGKELIEPFFESMEMDLYKKSYSDEGYKEYIYGSAEVVGLMCLKVFVKGDNQQYEELKPYAKSLGAAFQKVNFLRDLKDDFQDRSRTYFPNVDFRAFEEDVKSQIIQDIKYDFKLALEGIQRLPVSCKLGVYTAYVYYLKLLDKIELTPSSVLMGKRIRIPNSMKLSLMFRTFLAYKINVL